MARRKSQTEPLGSDDCDKCNAAIEELNNLIYEIEKAEAAGLPQKEAREVRDFLVREYEKLKRVYFPQAT